MTGSGQGPSPSEDGAAPTDDPEWVKGVVAKALLHATQESPSAAEPTPAVRVAAQWPSLQTTLPDFAGSSAQHTAPPAQPPPSEPTSGPGERVSSQRPAEPSPSMTRPTPQVPTPVSDALAARPPAAQTQTAQTQASQAQAPQVQATRRPAVSPAPTPTAVVEAIAARETISSDQLTNQTQAPIQDRRSASVSVASGSRASDDGLMEEADATTEGYRSSDLRTILEWLAVIVAALAVALLIKAFVLQAFWIPSESMETTVNKGDRILVNKISYRLHEVRRGDLVVFKKLPGTPGNTEDLIKRAIALPGETIEIRDDGRLWIWAAGETPEDAKRLEEPYLSPDDILLVVPSSPADGFAFGDDRCVNGNSPSRCTLAEDHFFMMGDNRNNSQDSRVFGPIPGENIVGRAFLRIWPPTDISTL